MRLVKDILVVCLLAVLVLHPDYAPGQQSTPTPSPVVTLAWSPSPDPNVTGYNLYYGAVSGATTNKLNVGSALTAAVSDLQAGNTYFFFATAYNAALAESEPSNQIIYTPVITNYADLIITAVSCLPASPVEGDAIRFSAVVANQGTAAVPAGSNVRVIFWINGGPAVAWCSVTNLLSPGASTLVAPAEDSAGFGTWTAITGLHSVIATVDSLGAVVESVETNNQFQVALQVNPAPTPVVAIAVDQNTVSEADAEGVWITLSRTGSLTTGLNVGLSFGGSARSGVNYVPAPDTLLIPAGQASASFRLIPIADGVVDEGKYLEVQLLSGTGYQMGSPASAGIAITNADEAPSPLTPSVTLAWSPSPDTNVTGYHLYYGDLASTLTNKLNAGNALSTTVSNLQVGVTYFFFATAYNAAGAESDPSNLITYAPAETRLVDLKITSVSILPASPVEGNVVQFCALVTNQGTASLPLGTSVRVGFSLNGGPVVAWCGFTNALLPGETATLLAGEASGGGGGWTAVAGTHVVTAMVDDLGVLPESVETNNQFTLAVQVSPAPRPSVTLGFNKSALAEGDPRGATLTLQRTGSNTNALGVTLSFAGTAKVGTDYAPLPQTVVIPAGTNSVAIQLTPISNGIADGDKSVIVSLVAAADYETLIPASASVVIVDQDRDSDGDGLSDAAELLAGTDAHDPDSGLKIASLQPAGPGQLVLGWASVPGITYRVMAKDSLPDASWQPVSPPIAATSATASWVVTTTNLAGFFAVTVEVDPRD